MGAIVSKVDLARELLKEFPERPLKQIARVLQQRHPMKFNSLEHARSIVRNAAGQHGKHMRDSTAKRDHYRKPGKAGQPLICPPAWDDGWGPHELPRNSRILCLSDAHIPFHSERAITASVEWAKKHFRPTVLLLNGDWADFYAVSQWERDPDVRDLVAELGVVEDSLAWLKSQFPKALRVYKLGNHEDRLRRYLWTKAPELAGLNSLDVRNVLHLSEHGFECVGDSRPVMAGKLPILHGHELQKGIAAPVNPARGAFLRTLHSVLVAHSHRTSSHSEPNMNHEETMAWSQGCMCNLRPPYARYNKWDHSFATIEVSKDGEFDVALRRLSSDFKVRAT